MRVCEGTDYVAVGYTFWVLMGLRRSPKTPDIYIEKIIQFMGLDIPLHTRLAAMHAACAVRTEVASLGRNDASLRYRFSEALKSAVLGDTQVDNPFRDLSFVNRCRIPSYLRLLCTFVKDATWHGQLQRSSHLESCLTIADTLTHHIRFMTNVHNETVVHVTHIFAIIDALHEEHESLQTIQTYPSSQLIMAAWRHIFSFDFFR